MGLHFRCGDVAHALEQAQHTIDGRNVDVKAAMPKSRGGSTEKGKKMFVGGVPVSIPFPSATYMPLCASFQLALG